MICKAYYENELNSNDYEYYYITGTQMSQNLIKKYIHIYLVFCF